MCSPFALLRVLGDDQPNPYGVRRYLHRRVGVDLADDLAAETFALAFERRASCRAGGSVLPWLYEIATNLLRRGWRRTRLPRRVKRTPVATRSARRRRLPR